MNKIKKVLLFAMSFVMATGLFAGCFVVPPTSSSSESTVSESSSESSTESSVESSVESPTESSVESSVESSTESSTDSSVDSSTDSSVDSSTDSSVDSSTDSSVDSSTDSSVEETKYVFAVVVDDDTTTSTEVAAGEVLVLPADPTANGKTFAGWVDGEKQPVVEGAVMPEEDFTIYATWTITPYTLTIKEDGKEDVTLTFGIERVDATETTDEIIAIDELDSSIEGLLPEATEETEYVFEGKPEEWTLENTTISIVSRVRRYWLTIQDGSPVDPNAYYVSEQVEWGSDIELPTRENTEGKTFVGWFYFDLETEEELAAPETMPKFDIRIYAKWELVTRTLTVNKADGSVETYNIAVESGYDDVKGPIIALNEIDWNLQFSMTEPFSDFYTVSYEGIPETWELQDYTINEVAVSSIAYLDRLNKTWAQKPNNANNYWDGAENVVSVEHLANGVTKVGFDATLFTDEQLEAAGATWSANREMWVTFAVPVNGANLNKFSATLDVKFENMSPKFNVLAAKNYVGDEGYDFEMGNENGFTTENTSVIDLGDGWYRFTVQIPAGDVVGNAADYLLFSFDNVAADVDKSLPSYAYIANLDLLCIHEYSAACDPTCELCGEARYDAAAHSDLTEDYISDEWGMHYQLCLTCGSRVNLTMCETEYVYDENGHYEVCALCGYETVMEEHWIDAGYTDEGHYDEGCYCGYIDSTIVPHNKENNFSDYAHWESCTDCWWEGEYIPHSGELEMGENGHKVLGCDGCDYAGSDEEVPHVYGEWTVSAEHDWISESECECGAKQVIKNKLDVPAQYFLTEEGILDVTGIFSEGADPETAMVTAAWATYTYWDYEAGANVEDYTHDFYTYNTAVEIDGEKVTYALDLEVVAAAPYFYGYKVITLTIEIGGISIDIPVTVTAVTKVINTAEELQALGVGGGILADNGKDYGGNGNGAESGNDIVGYYLLGDDIDATGVYFAAGYVTSKSYFKGTFDGNGHTISNVSVSEGGIFGGMHGATVKNVNFKNVEYHGYGKVPGAGYNNTQQYGQYFGLLAQAATSTTITDVNVQISALYTNTDLGKQTGVLVYNFKGGDNKVNNVNVDASGLTFNNVLGIAVDDTKVTFTKVTIKAAGYSTAIGYKDDSGTALTDWPKGVTFEQVILAMDMNGAVLPTYENDATEMGFAADDHVQVVTMNSSWSDRIALGDSKTANYLVFDFALSAPGNMTVWVMANGEMVSGYSYVVLANNGGLYLNEGKTPREFTVVDQDGNVVNSALSANTKYTMYVYLGVGTSTEDATKTCDIDGIQLGANETDFYVANLRYADSSVS